MNKENNTTKDIYLIFWLLIRLLRLNVIAISIPIVLAFTRSYFETESSFSTRFPYLLYTIALIISNLVYISGNIFEIFYPKSEEKEIEIRKFEGKYFKIATILIALIYTAGIVNYLIQYYS